MLEVSTVWKKVVQVDNISKKSWSSSAMFQHFILLTGSFHSQHKQDINRQMFFLVFFIFYSCLSLPCKANA